MNPYYATGFLSALFFWVWPTFLFRSLDAPLFTVIGFAAIIFLGAGRLASDFHIRFIAPKKPPRGPIAGIAMVCAAIVAAAALTRLAYDLYAGA
jgi:hypothetical protein